MKIEFVGYVPYLPEGAEGYHYHAEFKIYGHSTFPEGAQVNWDTLIQLHLKPPPFPSYWEFTKERFVRLLKNKKILNEIGK